MLATASEDQRAVGETVTAFLADRAGLGRIRCTIDGGKGWDAELWEDFAGELGFAGIGIAETYGGAGLGLAELGIVAEALGRTLAPIPWFESAVLAAGLIAEGDGGDIASETLSGIASGRMIVTTALRDAEAAPLPEGIGPAIKFDGAAWRLEGTASYVSFGTFADRFVVAARTDEGPTLLIVSADSDNLIIEPLASLDPTRPLARIRFNQIAVDPSMLLGPIGGARPAITDALARAAAVLAAEQIGGMARSFDETLAYAKQRVQFGRTIGSFQAVKHRLADMKLLLEAARSAVDWAIETERDEARFPVAAAAALAECSDAYRTITGDAIQLHGGIGFTWEHHAHLFFKRARSSSTLLDPPSRHRESVAESIIKGDWS